MITVGDDPACDYTASTASNGLQQAIDDAALDANGADETLIRVARSGSYVDRRYFVNDLTDQSVTLIGGYETCDDTDPAGTTTLDRGGASVGPVLMIDRVASAQQTNLENLRLIGGDGGDGGGIEVRNNNFVFATDLVFEDNAATLGGGAAVTDDDDGTATALWLLGGSRVTGNTADFFGGGIACSGPQASLVMDTDVAVDNNQTAGIGGGLFLRSGCGANVYASFPAGFQHIENLHAGFDAVWPCFANFEGVEAVERQVDARFLSARSVGLENLAALELFTSAAYMGRDPETIERVVRVVSESARLCIEHPMIAREVWYRHAGDSPDPLTDAILEDTCTRFVTPLVRDRERWRAAWSQLDEQSLAPITQDEFDALYD